MADTESQPAEREQSSLSRTRESEYDASRNLQRRGYGDLPGVSSNGSPSLSRAEREERIAHALGWFSIGLGLAEIIAPRGLAKLIGTSDNRTLLRILGVREIASGVGILSRRRPVGWLWSRVGGDIMDLAVLGMALTSPNANRRRIAAATAAVTGVTVLDVRASQRLSSQPELQDSAVSIQVKKSITINRSPEDLYQFWHEFQTLPRFMSDLESVENTGEKRSHWVVKGPAGKRIHWDAEITEDRPNELIAWRSLEGSQVQNSGSVRFEPAQRKPGTVVRVEIEYRPPAGLLGATVAKFLGAEPKQQLHENLHRFRQLMETGEIITTEGQPAGRSQSTSWKYDRTGRRLAASI
ncbi:MAG TPA: SRPBCC family protein [Candidatus Binatia bacterium]